MFSSLRYPTKQQSLIWLKRRQGVIPSAIAKEMGVSRPFISKAQGIAEARIEKLLRNAAYVNRINIEQISGKYGFAVGYCSAYDSRTYVTYSPTIGVQMWFSHKGECQSCAQLNECEKILKELGKEWRIKIPAALQPTDIAVYLFDSIVGRLGWIRTEG